MMFPISQLFAYDCYPCMSILASFVHLLVQPVLFPVDCTSYSEPLVCGQWEKCKLRDINPYSYMVATNTGGDNQLYHSTILSSMAGTY